MKKILALILTAVLISLLVIPVGTALADKDFHTVRLPLSLTQDGADAGHTLRNGMMMRTHTEGPINYYVMSVILNGAKPDTTYDIGWAIQGIVDVDGNPVYTRMCQHSIETDKNGNGNLHYKNSPEVVRATVYPFTTITFNAVLIEGGQEEIVQTYLQTPGGLIPYLPMPCLVGGVAALETDWHEVTFDWDW